VQIYRHCWSSADTQTLLKQCRYTDTAAAVQITRHCCSSADNQTLLQQCRYPDTAAAVQTHERSTKQILFRPRSSIASILHCSIYFSAFCLSQTNLANKVLQYVLTQQHNGYCHVTVAAAFHITILLTFLTYYSYVSRIFLGVNTHYMPTQHLFTGRSSWLTSSELI